MKRRIIAILLCLALFLASAGFAASRNPSEESLTEAEDAAETAGTELDEAAAAAVMDFAVRLFQNSAVEGENTLISPVSVLYALVMTANGAAGNTLEQMEGVFSASISDLNEYLSAYMNRLPTGDGYKLNIANAVWFRDDDRLTVLQDFLDLNTSYYGAGIFQESFDLETLDNINNWVSEQTDGMIPKILDEIDDNAVLYLVNALSFDAEWETIYQENQIYTWDFTKEDGTVQEAEMMYSEESLYVEDENAVGFIKFYADETYAFVALLPNEGISVADYIASLTGESLAAMLADAKTGKVDATMPKFTGEYSGEMSEILTAMGMTDAFDEELADFSRMAQFEDGNISISRVLHKTRIAVDESGTKAGAATVVEMIARLALEPAEKVVFLDRPFVYLLIDCETNTPVFMGTVMDLG